MGNDQLVRTTFVTTHQVQAAAREIGGGNLSKGCNDLIRRGLDAMAGRPELDLSPAELAELLAHRLREEARQPASITTAPVPVSPAGAAVVPDATGEVLDHLRRNVGAALVVAPKEVWLFGHTPEGRHAALVLDAEEGVLAIDTGDVRETVRLDAPAGAVHAMAQQLAAALGRAAGAVAVGQEPADAPAVEHPNLRLRVWADHPTDHQSRLQIGQAALCCHSLLLTGLASELFALQVRLVSDGMNQRQSLEQLLKSRPLAGARSHGEG